MPATRNVLGVTRSVYRSDGNLFARYHLAAVPPETESGWTDTEALCGAKLVHLYDEQWEVRICTRCARKAAVATEPTPAEIEPAEAVLRARIAYAEAVLHKAMLDIPGPKPRTPAGIAAALAPTVAAMLVEECDLARKRYPITPEA